MEWEIIYAELSNKLRWSISSTADAAGFNWSFRESQSVANLLASDALNVMKMRDKNPDTELTTAALKVWLDGKKLDS
jgi:hypothetical protein